VSRGFYAKADFLVVSYQYCLRSSLLRLGFADEMTQVCAEVGVHEGVDERVSDVVSEVQVEDGGVPGKPVEGHEEPWCEGDNKHYRDDEQCRRRAKVGEKRAFRLTTFVRRLNDV